MVGLTAVGAATLGYAVGVERRHWTLRRFEVPVLPAGSRPLTVLHLSDIHMTPGQRSKQAWIRSLAELRPDLVINTGDNLAAQDAVPATLDALGPLLDRPGAFVFGSNDYFGPVPKNPLRYFDPHHKRTPGPRLPWRALRDGLTAAGWVDLTNARAELALAGLRVVLAGVDDPHLRRDRYDRVAGSADRTADLRLGLVHAPEPRVLDRFAADGYDLLLCGHTHGGQLRVPWFGALVTNCGIDRPRARWLHPWRAGSWLHVSAGLGTSPYAPFRFACPPEATLLTLVPRATDGPPRLPAGSATLTGAPPGCGAAW
ncbi:MAG: metallophosphoesterase [Actinobacteria bacterium]|nr:metallophosphoesterase [Actinomycetota bacterium]MBI3686403.1 metallophosphoesterase [Actinomycetota bacterium]